MLLHLPRSSAPAKDAGWHLSDGGHGVSGALMPSRRTAVSA